MSLLREGFQDESCSGNTNGYNKFIPTSFPANILYNMRDIAQGPALHFSLDMKRLYIDYIYMYMCIHLYVYVYMYICSCVFV